jgi:hypothetical protein
MMRVTRKDRNKNILFMLSTAKVSEVLIYLECGMPPEYCQFAHKTDFQACKDWLAKHHPKLYKQVHGELPAQKEEKKE